MCCSPASNSDNENDASEVTKERRRIVQDPQDDSEGEESRSLALNWEETQDIEPNPESATLPRSNTEELFPSLTCKKGKLWILPGVSAELHLHAKITLGYKDTEGGQKPYT